MKNTVNIHGKEYETVASRVQRFREEHPTYTLSTHIEWRDENEVVMKASILDDKDRLIATGHAEEQRQSSAINRTSALENAETSAIGRALAAFGMAGTEFASADEVANAIHQQAAPKPAVGSKPQKATAVQKARITAYLRGQGVETDDMTDRLYSEYGVKEPSEMTHDEAEAVIDQLKAEKINQMRESA